MFLAICAHESKLALTEAGWLSENAVREWCKQYEPGTDRGKRLGNTKDGDGYLFRGAGYIQLSGRANYESFASDVRINDPLVVTRGANYVADNYAWETACWFWNSNGISNKIRNDIAGGVDKERVFLQASNAVYRGNYSSSNTSDGEFKWNNRLSLYRQIAETL